MKQNIKSYINKILGSDVLRGHFVSVTDLPFYLLDLYDFYVVNFLQKKCIFMLVKGDNQTAANISKHILTVKKQYALPVIYVSRSLHSYQRKRLIDKNIAFIVPGNQMYLPMFALDLREYFKQSNPIKKNSLNPLAQVLILQYLNEKQYPPLTTKHMLHTTNYSPMTINRAFNQLADYKLAKLVKVGREKQLSFIDDKKTLWQNSLDYLKNPIKKILLLSDIRNDANIFQAGETALSEQTTLTPPIFSQCAIDYKQWLKIKNQYQEDVEGRIKLEIWYYDPGLISNSHIVDKYSLYLSLSDNDDARVQMALEELLSK